MEHSAFSNGVQVAWDSTSLKLAETCLRKYQYKMIEGWQPRRKSVHLLFGGWYATALEHYYKHRALGLNSNDALIFVVREALEATWIREENYNGPWISDHPTKTRENLIRTIVWYVDQFENEKVEVVRLNDGSPAVEYSFRLSVDDGVMFSGHIDRLVTFSDQYYVMDQKTTASTLGSYYFDQFNPDTQFSLYTFAGQMIYHLPVTGVIIDAAQVAVGFTRFERGFTFRTKAQLDEWYGNALWHIRLAQQATEKKEFPMNDTSCNNYGGCEFRGICSRSPEVRKNFLLGDFTQEEVWNPLRSR